MSENTTSDQAEAPSEQAQQKAKTLPPPPEMFQFPVQLLEQWTDIPENERINAPLTRQDIDHLIFGLLRNCDALALLDRVVVAWSNGKIEEANLDLTEFRRISVESVNRIRQFFTGLMISAIRERSDVPKT